MRIELNGAAHTATEGTTLLALIVSVAGSARGRAVVVDGVVVPRSAWPSWPVRDGQRIELISAVQGG